MPSNQPTPAQWMYGWTAAVQQAQRNAANNPGTPPPVQPQVSEPKKEEKVEDIMQGGWRFEGKEKPITPVICTKCQWARSNNQETEPDQSMWCESCLEDKPGPGNDPDKGYRPPVSRAEDVANLNKSFFG